jgi:hypothetical protein
MSAASTVSADATVNDEGFGVYHFTADPNVDIEEEFIDRENMIWMLNLAKSLTVIQRKVLRLKGVPI